MVDDESPKFGNDPSDRDESEDREIILARRRMLIATAMTGLAVTAEGCDWLASKLGRTPFTPGAPSACLNVAAPTVCLQVPATIAEDAGPAAIPCLSTTVAPMPCLSEQPSTTPTVCLRVRRTEHE